MEPNKNHKKAHSAEYFGETRDFWWNADFLELMKNRLKLDEAKSVLDVGCGIGHWGQALACVLSKEARLVGVDPELEWITEATKRAGARGLADRFWYQLGDVTCLDFESGSFDLVTCQTVLIHLRDPKEGLKEMLRVLKPGGTLLVVEPNNMANRLVASNLSEKLSVGEVVERLRFGLIIERGKQALGLGFNSAGDLIPGYLTELGASKIRVYLSDKASPLFAPYSSKEQQAIVEELKDWTKKRFVGWDREELRRYFVAGGGEEKLFELYWNLLLKDSEDVVRAMGEGSFHTAGGGVSYLIAAQKN